MNRAFGIDFSKWNGIFTPQGNIDFCIIKATEGLATDPMFEENLDAVMTVPRRGAYHYFRTDYDPIEQAEHFWNTVKDKGFHFLVVDYEKTNNTLDEIGATSLNRFWNAVINESDPIRLVLYTSPYIFRDNLLAYDDVWDEDPLWMAHYNGQDPETGEPNTWGNDWVLWQYSADGNGKGAEYGVESSAVDLNVFNGTVAEMDEWLNIEAPQSDCCGDWEDLEAWKDDADGVMHFNQQKAFGNATAITELQSLVNTEIAELAKRIDDLRQREIDHTREHNARLDELELQVAKNLEGIISNRPAMQMMYNEIVGKIDDLENKTIPQTNHSHRKLFSWIFNRR